MVLPLIAAGIGAATNIIGGILGNKAQKKAQNAQIAEAQRQSELQREFAQNSVQWRVEDAKKAGVHPIYALGAQGASYTPTQSVFDGGSPLAAGIANAGQDVSRGLMAHGDQQMRNSAYSKAVEQLTLTRMGLENELLASQIAKVNQPGLPPARPPSSSRYLIDGQGQTALPSLVQDEPMTRVVSAPGAPHVEPGAVNEVGYARTKDGWAVVPSSDVKQRIEDDIFSEIGWQIRNRLKPILMPSAQTPPPDVPLKPGHFWYFDPLTGVYRQQSRYLKDF